MEFVKRKKLPIPLLAEMEDALLASYNNAVVVSLNKLSSEVLAASVRVDHGDMVLRQAKKSIEPPSPHHPTPRNYSLNQQVLVRLSKGIWVEGMVTTLNPCIEVKRPDGSIVLVKDLSHICDAGGSMGSNPIILEEFDVIIPEGSQSYLIETGLDAVTAEMNRTPLSIDKNTWVSTIAKQQLLQEDLRAKCQSLSSIEDFNPASRAHCMKEFLQVRGLPVLRGTKAGQPALDKEVLEMWADMGDSLAHLVVLAREAATVHSQLTAWKPYADAGFVQTKWLQYGTPHGRYSSESPCIQNRVLPIRETIVSKEGYKFISLDWGSAEYVVWASLSKDPFLSKVFLEGSDLHTEMGARLSPILGSECDLRKAGKTVNFALLYGMLPVTLGKILDIDVTEALKVKGTFEQYATSAVRFRNDIILHAMKSGFVETAFGRRRMVKVSTYWGGKDDGANKTAWHHVNAGTAAELLKWNTLLQWESVRKSYSYDQARLVINMHDEVIWEVKDSLVPSVREVLLSIMSTPPEGFLPFKVDCRVGSNWLEISK